MLLDEKPNSVISGPVGSSVGKRVAHKEVARKRADEVIIDETSAVLSAIHRPDCAAAIWHRPLPACFTTWIENLAVQNLPQARLILKPEDVARSVQRLFEEAGTLAGPHQDFLLQDITGLAENFCAIMQVAYLRLRLDVISDNKCSRFHKDAVTARLICTYRGDGTQYGFSSTGEEPAIIKTVPAGSPIIMRGTCWPETPDPGPNSGFVHRSPPIKGTGQTRLLLVFDPITNPDQAI